MNKKGQSAKSIEAQYNILRVAIAILISLLLAFVLIALVGGNPLDALKQFILEPISSRRNFGNVIELAIPLTFAGLAVCVMFQCNQFNMGVQQSCPCLFHYIYLLPSHAEQYPVC